MDNSNEEKTKTKCQKKYSEFTDTVDGMNLNSLEGTLLQYARHREEVELAKKNDQGLQEAKDKVTELNGPYRDSLAALKLKMAYLHLALEEVKENPSLQPVANG